MDKAKALTLVLLILTAFAGCQQEPAAESKGVPTGSDSGTIEKHASSRDVPQTDVQASKSEATSAPDIKFEHTEFNFGEVVSGTKVQHVFTFKNVGNAELNIIKVGSS